MNKPRQRLNARFPDAVNDERAVSVPRCVSRRDAGWPSIEDGRYCAILGDESYLENPHRPTLSLSYNSLDEITGDADTREIFTKSGTRWTRSLGAVPAFFENLLPEGALLDWIADQRQVSTHDAFELLAATGSSLPGALVIRPSDIERLGARLERHAAALQEGGRRDVVATPVAAPVEGAFSLAGQQMKLALSM